MQENNERLLSSFLAVTISPKQLDDISKRLLIFSLSRNVSNEKAISLLNIAIKAKMESLKTTQAYTEIKAISDLFYSSINKRSEEETVEDKE